MNVPSGLFLLHNFSAGTYAPPSTSTSPSLLHFKQPTTLRETNFDTHHVTLKPTSISQIVSTLNHQQNIGWSTTHTNPWDSSLDHSHQVRWAWSTFTHDILGARVGFILLFGSFQDKRSPNVGLECIFGFAALCAVHLCKALQ